KRSSVPAMGASSSARVRGSKALVGAGAAAAGRSAAGRGVAVDIGVYAPIIRAYAPIVNSDIAVHAGLQLSGAAPGGPLRDPALRPLPGAHGSAGNPVLDPGPAEPPRPADHQRAGH